MKYEGRIYFDGEIPIIQSRTSFIDWLKVNIPKDSWLDFQVIPRTTTTEQQRLYHTWKDIIAEALGWDSKDLHNYFKEHYNNNSTTKGFTVPDWVSFMNKIKAFAANKGINLPQGNEKS